MNINTRIIVLCLLGVPGFACSGSETACDSMPSANRTSRWDEKQDNGDTPLASALKVSAASGTYQWQWSPLSGNNNVSTLRISIVKGEGTPRYAADEALGSCARSGLRFPLSVEATTMDGKLVLAPTTVEGTNYGRSISVSVPVELGASQLKLQVEVAPDSTTAILLVKATTDLAVMGQKFSTEQWGHALTKVVTNP